MTSRTESHEWRKAREVWGEGNESVTVLGMGQGVGEACSTMGLLVCANNADARVTAACCQLEVQSKGIWLQVSALAARGQGQKVVERVECDTVPGLCTAGGIATSWRSSKRQASRLSPLPSSPLPRLIFRRRLPSPLPQGLLLSVDWNATHRGEGREV